jgi:CheY-like chemotaxis protein
MNMRLLIADDDLTFRVMLEKFTRQWGFDPIMVKNGEEAWEIYQQSVDPFLMLIDWEMPKLNGLDLCKRIRNSQSNHRISSYILLLTSRNKTNDIVIGLDAGANDYVVKPFAYAELQARLNAGLRIMELQLELVKAHDALAFERETIENIILKNRHSKPFEPQGLRHLDHPVERTSGDILLSAINPEGCHHLMLGDFTGHGLMAAVAGPIVFDIFYTMTAKGIALQEIIQEMNHQLLQKMPVGLFLGAIFIELCSLNRQLKLWNCGMSDVLVYRGSHLLSRFRSNKLALGILKDDYASNYVVPVEVGDRVYAYSDGMTETVNKAREEFGQLRLEEAISHMLQFNQPINYLSRQLFSFKGREKQFDDITLVEMYCE